MHLGHGEVLVVAVVRDERLAAIPSRAARAHPGQVVALEVAVGARVDAHGRGGARLEPHAVRGVEAGVRTAWPAPVERVEIQCG